MTGAQPWSRLGFVAFAICMQAFPARAETVPKHASVLAEFSAAIEELTDKVGPAVVQIDVRARELVDREDARRTGYFAEHHTSGSGVIVDPSGYIITNAHVIEGAREVDVSVADHSSPARRDAHRHLQARIVGSDKETDIAVLKVDGEHLPVLSFRDSDTLRQGQIVFALGSPLGLDNTLTVGYISAVARHLRPDRPMTYIQTDAPINPGNSGGPLLDGEGRVVGINTLILTQSGGSEGIGFAIPANLARGIYEQLRKEGHVHRGAIGVISQDISPVLSAALELDRHPGVILSDVLPHSSAEAAGVEAGDIVLAVDGKPVTEALDIKGIVFQRPVGDSLVLDLLRGRQKVQKTVVIVERPHSPGSLADLVVDDTHLVRELGILALTLDDKVTPILPDLRRLSGVVVAAIPAEFASLNPGLQPGDVIYELNATPIQSLEGLRKALGLRKPGDPIALLTEHEGTLGYVAFKLE